MRSFALNPTTIPVAFTAIRCSRRAQLWNRQASIIKDLTTLALRHGWFWPFDLSSCACDAFRKLVAVTEDAAILPPPIALLVTGQAPTTASKSQATRPMGFIPTTE